MANPFIEDDWDWPFILYAGRVFLNYTEAEIWNLTPRQLLAQMEVHNFVEQRKAGENVSRRTVGNEPVGYIDQIPGW